MNKINGVENVFNLNISNKLKKKQDFNVDNISNKVNLGKDDF